MNTRTRTRSFGLAAVVFSIAAVVAGTAVAQTSQQSDALVQDVWAKLTDEKLDKEVAEVSTRDDAVVLTGQPANAWLKMKVIEAVLEVEGVEAVESDLEVAEPESAEDVAKALIDRVITYPQYTVFDDITFAIADGGFVTLAGAVTKPFKKDEIEKRIGTIMGVRDLRSEIRVLPVSPSDDRLRAQLYRNIYGDSFFEGFAQQAHPPIHIIVDGSRVTLTGAVRSNVEKMKAASIANSTFRVTQVENRLQINP